MKDLIEKILHISKNLRLTCNQSLFLLAMKDNIYNVDLPGDELMTLVTKGYIKGNFITEKAIEEINKNLGNVLEDKIEAGVRNLAYPILNKDSAEIIKILASYLFTGYNVKEKERLRSYINNEVALPFLHLFLCMFPTSDNLKNQKWETHFGNNSSGVTLRRLTNGTTRKFQQIWKNKDIGLFLFGTYIFITESYNSENDKYYVKKIENYLAEWEYWYNIAEDKANNGELKQIITSCNNQKIRKNNNTTVI